MSNYQIKVNIEIVESKDSLGNNPKKTKDGCFNITISEADAINIDKIENALLKTNYEAIRDAISRHLQKLSKKEAFEVKGNGTLINNHHPFEVDGEVGRFSFQTHSVEKEGKIIYNTAQSLFPKKKGREQYKTSGFKEISMILGTTNESYRKATFLINRMRYQEGATPLRTLQDNTDKEGAKVIEFIEKKTDSIFNQHDFTKEGIPQSPAEYAEKQGAFLPEEEVQKAIEACEVSPEKRVEIEKNPVCHEDSTQTINISLDIVEAKRQKEKRAAMDKENPASKQRKKVQNTIAHIQKDDKSYTINSYDVPSTLRILIGFLINNDLLKYRLQFFVDGEKKLYTGILKAFSWFSNIGILLDWYHLKKKCQELLSMAMKGRHVRNDVLSQLMPLLWDGMVDKAIEYLSNLNAESIKSQEVRDKLISYLKRNQPYIPCYKVRKKLGLRNSSNIGEKMNDLIVSDRQKHKGMSWSRLGSVALATITALKRNKEYALWFEEGNIKLQLAA